MRAPGFYEDALPSCRVSKYYVWFKDLGYPMLDIEEYEDGEWSIIQYHVKPIIPCLTPYNHVLMGIKNTPITHPFVEKYVDMIDITKKAFWAAEDEKSENALQEAIDADLHQEEMVTKAHAAITKNPDLMGRIAKFGVAEMDLMRIAKHIPHYRW